jgi:hypothetical protein
MDSLKVAFGLILLFFLPGLALTMAIWPLGKNEVAKQIYEGLKKKV